MVSEKKISTPQSEVWMSEKGILYLRMKDYGEVDLEEATLCFKIYKEMGIGPENKVVQMIIATGTASITPEARKYAAEHGRNFFLASAVISESLAVRLVVNFFNTFYRHPVPLKMFETEEKALAWLNTFKK